MRFGMKSLLVIAAATLVAPAALADGDADKGKKTFKKCKACHKIGEGAKNGTGPLLNDVMGRAAGTAEGYKFSDSMIAAGAAGLVWNEETLTAYLENPKKYLQEYLDDSGAKTKMALKLKKEKDRVNVVAYVATFSAPVEEAVEETSD